MIIAAAFELDPANWLSIGYETALAGARFDKAIVMRPDADMPKLQVKRINAWVQEVVAFKLPAGRKVQFI